MPDLVTRQAVGLTVSQHGQSVKEVHKSKGNCPVRSSMKTGASGLSLTYRNLSQTKFVGGILKSSIDSFFISTVEDIFAYTKLTGG